MRKKELFLVEIMVDNEEQTLQFRGVIKHIKTGQWSHFTQTDELYDIINDILTNARNKDMED